MIMTAQRPEVSVHRRAAVRPLAGVVTVCARRGRPAARVDTGTVPDLGTSPQRPARAAPLRVIPAAGLPLPFALPLPFGLPLPVGLARQVGDQSRPAAQA